MENLNLWEDLKPISIEEISDTLFTNDTLSNLFSSIFDKTPDILELINFNINDLDSLNKVLINVYKTSDLNKDEENLFVQSLPYEEQQHLKTFKSVSHNKTVIECCDSIRLNPYTSSMNKFESIFSIF